MYTHIHSDGHLWVSCYWFYLGHEANGGHFGHISLSTNSDVWNGLVYLNVSNLFICVYIFLGLPVGV